MDIMEIIKEAVIGSALVVKQILFILIPLMVIIQILRETGIIDQISRYLRPVMRALSMRDEAAFPLVVGEIFGITYGAGAILESGESGGLSKRDCYLLAIFLGICHALFEDTMLFVAIGASLPVLIISGIVLALLVTYVLGKIWRIDTHAVSNDDVG